MTLLEETDQIQAYLDITCSENPDEIQERIRGIMPYISRTGFMLAEAKKLLRKKKASEISNTIIAIAKEQCLSAKVQNTMIDSIAENEAYLVDRLDRLNAACTHQVDALRSLLSYNKEELRLTKSGY
jgi:predicted RNase H-like nuclease